MQGHTLTLWEVLASLATVDLTDALVAEVHLDALAVLREARRHGQVSEEDWNAHTPSWSAARLWIAAPSGSGCVAGTDGETWTLSGETATTVVAGLASHALVTAATAEGERLFAVDLDDGRVRRASSPPRITFERAPAVRIGDPGWHRSRPGAPWSAVGTAAVWYGAAVGLAREESDLPGPDPACIGAMDVALGSAHAVLEEAAAIADDRGTPSEEAHLVGRRTCLAVADACRTVVAQVGSARPRAASLVRLIEPVDEDLADLGSRTVRPHDGWSWRS
jgi:hypothetical protein